MRDLILFISNKQQEQKKGEEVNIECRESYILLELARLRSVVGGGEMRG